jgi:hypothetical protein
VILVVFWVLLYRLGQSDFLCSDFVFQLPIPVASFTLFVGRFGDFPSCRASARNSVSASPDSSRFHLLVSWAQGHFFPSRFSFVANLRLGCPDFLSHSKFSVAAPTSSVSCTKLWFSACSACHGPKSVPAQGVDSVTGSHCAWCWFPGPRVQVLPPICFGLYPPRLHSLVCFTGCLCPYAESRARFCFASSWGFLLVHTSGWQNSCKAVNVCWSFIWVWILAC